MWKEVARIHRGKNSKVLRKYGDKMDKRQIGQTDETHRQDSRRQAK